MQKKCCFCIFSIAKTAIFLLNNANPTQIQVKSDKSDLYLNQIKSSIIQIQVESDFDLI
jgi:hypothetical protein